MDNPQTTRETMPCGCWSENTANGITISACEKHRAELAQLAKDQPLGTVKYVADEDATCQTKQ